MDISLASPVWQLLLVAGFIIALIVAAKLIGRNAKKRRKRKSKGY